LINDREKEHGETALEAPASAIIVRSCNAGWRSRSGELAGYGGYRRLISRGPLLLLEAGATDDWRELAQAVKAAGFGGIDLTVRKGGHVAPERVKEDLPKAVEVGDMFRELVAVAEECGVQVGYHNHAGYVGASLWDMGTVMDTLDPKWAGYYFDLQHATGEGGIACWKIDTLLAMPRIKMLAVKDMYWKKTAKEWADMDCPLGQGMCHYKEFLKMVALGGFHGRSHCTLSTKSLAYPGTMKSRFRELRLAMS
jgi:sugar phosphate isomerase/epimerase